MTNAVTIRRYEGPPRPAGGDYYEPPPPVLTLLGPSAGGLALIALLVAVHGLWAAQLLLVPMLLVVPGVVLLRALRVPGRAVASFPVYVPVASLVVLLFSGLAVDWIGLLAGDATPLRVGPLLAGFELICFALLLSSSRAPTAVTIPWHLLPERAKTAWPLIVPLAAAAGAIRLNNGHGGTVAILAACAVVVAVITTMIVAPRRTPAELAVVLYATGLALIWSVSLRGALVQGYDINREYYLMNHTVLAGVWYTFHVGDAYGAMLSVTVLPAELHALSGVSGLMVFKVVYPAIYALFPVAIFFLARRVISRRWSFMAAAFTMGEFAFPQIAGFARQESAFVYFAALIAAILDTRIQRRARWILVILFGFALAVSHYSTTYMAITLTGLALLLQWLASWIRDIPRVSGALAIGFATVTMGAAIWYGPLTHSASGLAQFAQTVDVQGVDLLPNRVQGENLLAAYLQGNTLVPIQAQRYEQLIHNEYSVERPYITPLPDASLPRYTLRDSPVPKPRVKWSLGYDSLSIGMLIIEQLANIFAGVGALWMVLRRRATLMARQTGLFALAALLVLMVIRVSGTVAEAYGQERALIQAMVFLGISLCWTIQGLTGRGEHRWARMLAVTAACLAVVFVNATYLVNAALGGGISETLANGGVAFEHYYRTQPEFASARWLGRADPTEVVYADEYGQLPLIAMTGFGHGLLTDLTPLTLNQHAWVYASRTNTLDGRAFAQYQLKQATYVFPARFIEANFDLVYTNGSSEVFHR